MFLFIKNAGNKVFGIEKTYVKDSTDAATRKFELETAAAKRIAELIIELKLQVEDLNVFIDTDVAVISGLAYDQATREKVVLVIGNSNGIATVEDYMTVENEEPLAQFYTVLRGDTLRGIAKVYFGNAKNYSIIFDANKPMLNHPNKIYPGQVLRIPA